MILPRRRSRACVSVRARVIVRVCACVRARERSERGRKSRHRAVGIAAAGRAPVVPPSATTVARPGADKLSLPPGVARAISFVGRPPAAPPEYRTLLAPTTSPSPPPPPTHSDRPPTRRPEKKYKKKKHRSTHLLQSFSCPIRILLRQYYSIFFSSELINSFQLSTFLWNLRSDIYFKINIFVQGFQTNIACQCRHNIIIIGMYIY